MSVQRNRWRGGLKNRWERAEEIPGVRRKVPRPYTATFDSASAASSLQGFFDFGANNDLCSIRIDLPKILWYLSTRPSLLGSGRNLVSIAMPTIAIVGVGAIGAATASSFQIAKSNNGAGASRELFLCTRRPLTPTPLSVTTPTGLVHVEGTNLTTPPTDSLAIDWLIISTKAYHAAGTAEWFPALVGPQTRIAVLQNGVEHRERFAAYLSAEQQANLLPVIIDCPAEKQPDGSVLQRTWAKMVVPYGALGEEFASLFAGSNAQVTLSDDWTTAAWKKLCVNAAGALSALTLLPNSVFGLPGMKEITLGIIRETVAAGNAAGASIEDSYMDVLWQGLESAPPDGVNSLLADRLAGREMEIEARNGAVVRSGQKGGIETPLNAMAVAVLAAQQCAYLKGSS
jgi:2-dehydropantoate 2-reductase